jgi:type IV pilus assembly protein PilV
MNASLALPARRVRAAERGVTLVEVLVALVIMAVGLLGISGLYVETLRANRTAQLRTQAVNLVNDMADRIRANRRAQGDYAKTLGPALPDAADDCVTGACTATKLAKYDLANWDKAVIQRLPDNAAFRTRTAVVYAPVGTLDRYTVRVEWFEPSQADALFYQLVFDVVPPT